MKSAISTVSWGTHNVNFRTCCETISGFGVQGIELGQHPDYVDIRTGRELKSVLDSHGLHLAGMAFGSLHDRLRFCGDAIRPDYMYVDHWNDEVASFAEREDLTLALHPHAFKRIRREEDFIKLMSRYESLQLILDTGHAKILQINQEQFVDRWKLRLSAVHLKEWSEDYGRTVHKYSEGFLPLGSGFEPTVGSVLDLLISRDFSGWIVVEHSGVENMRLDFLAGSIRFISDRLKWKSIPRTQDPSRKLPADRVSFTVPPATRSRLTECREKLYSLSFRSNASFLPDACNVIHEFAECSFTSIWSVDNGQETVGCLAWSPREMDSLVETVISFENSFGAKTSVENRLFSCHDFSNPAVRDSFVQKELLAKYPDIRYLITFPVYSPANLSHARYLISFLSKGEFGDTKLATLQDVAELFGRMASVVLDAHSRELVAVAARLWTTSPMGTPFLDLLCKEIRQRLPCEGVSIFLPDADDEGEIHLYPKGSTGLFWRSQSEEHFYRRGEGLTGTVWARGDVMFSQLPADAHRGKGKSSETVQSTEVYSTLWIPILHDGDCIGVLRCRNKIRVGVTQTTRTFSDDDAAVLITLCENLSPYFEAVTAMEMRRQVLKHLSHEVRAPMKLIDGAVYDMENAYHDRSETQHHFRRDQRALLLNS